MSQSKYSHHERELAIYCSERFPTLQILVVVLLVLAILCFIGSAYTIATGLDEVLNGISFKEEFLGIKGVISLFGLVLGGLLLFARSLAGVLMENAFYTFRIMNNSKQND